MSARAYYNEHEPYCCDWLSNLMDAGAIMAGQIDERDIREVEPADVEGFERVHLFAGIGGWDRALELAGWGGPVWTGSVPCQPYSIAGKRSGASDPRHLWPELFRLVRECSPNVVFGEQVTGAIAHGWLDDLSADLEGEGYAVGATVLGAHCVGAPHLRQRLWWVADSDGWDASSEGIQRGRQYGFEPQDGGTGSGLDNPSPKRRQPDPENIPEHGAGDQQAGQGGIPSDRRLSSGLADSEGGTSRSRHHVRRGESHAGQGGGMGDAGRTGRQRRFLRDAPEGEGSPTGSASPWEDAVLIQCRDGKWRATPDPESGILPLAHGVSRRVEQVPRLRKRDRPSSRGRIREGLHGGDTSMVDMNAMDLVEQYRAAAAVDRKALAAMGKARSEFEVRETAFHEARGYANEILRKLANHLGQIDDR